MTTGDREARRRLEPWLATEGEGVDMEPDGPAVAAYRELKSRIRKRGGQLTPEAAEREVAEEVRRLREERKQPEDLLAEGY